MENPLVRAFWRKVQLEEIVPAVPPVPDVQLADYAEAVEHRFANPRVADTVVRMCVCASDRVPKFVHPSIGDRLDRGESVAGLALVSALWCHFCYKVMGTAEDSGASMDPAWQQLTVIKFE
jgi:mannitol 2-dehydrogenase